MCCNLGSRNIRCKLSNKARAKKAFDALYSILYLKAVRKSKDCGAAVQQALIAYFDNTWTAKWSAVAKLALPTASRNLLDVLAPARA
jgi:hypothetical protein